MHEIRLRGLDIRIVDDTILFSPAGNPDNVLRLDNAERQNLIEFLTTYQAEKREQRIGFRVPLNEELLLDMGRHFQVAASLESTPLKMICKDISLSGVGFELLEPAPPELEKNTALLVHLEWGNETQDLKGVVRRLETALMGVSFENDAAETEFDPPDTLIHMVRQLETQWLRRTRKSV